MPERPGAGQQAERVAFGIARRQQDRHEHAAQRQDRHARGAGERGEERAHQGGNNGRPAAELPDQRLEHPHQAFGRPAFGQEIARQREDGNAGEHVVGGEAVVFERHGLDRQVVAPKQDQRRAAQGGEDRRAQRASPAPEPPAPEPSAAPASPAPRSPAPTAAAASASARPRPALFVRGVPDQAQQDQAETERQDRAG